MSKQYPGGIISKTAPTPAGPYETGAAPGVWTLEQQMQYKQQGIWPTAGLQPNYIEDVFSTYLYTGNGSTQTITNGIDLSTKGGIVWCKGRSAAGYSNVVYDTINGVNTRVATNSTNGLTSAAASLTAFNTTGFSLGADAGGEVNQSAITYASWTFREQAKFFDVLTYTGDGIVGRTVAHNLGVVPGCIIVKRTTGAAANWRMYHRSLGATYSLQLNTTAAATTLGGIWDNTEPTSTVFSVGDNTNVNGSGDSYVAYLFAHDAGGFGLSGTDNVISCGSYTTGASGAATVTLGYEPQWILLKNTTDVDKWYILDNMRGWGMTQANGLYPNNSDAESDAFGNGINPTATGFNDLGVVGTNATIIYIAIRRGPMKVPTLGTSVFSPIAYTGNGTTNTTVQNLTTSFAGDTAIIQQRTSGNNPLVFDKLRGSTQGLYTSLTLVEENISTARPGQSVGFNNTQTVLTGRFTNQGNYNSSGDTFVGWNFGRAPSFFDEVCYTGTGAAMTVSHNLGAVPELIILKSRNNAQSWMVYAAPLGNNKYLSLNSSFESDNAGLRWNDTTPTSSVFSVGKFSGTTPYSSGSGYTYVTYLFATCAGVSKVGSYTGNGTTQTIDCGFGAGGARFVLIKRTDAAGDWYVYDTARGMTVLTDPYLQLNNTNAEVATLGSVTTVSTGFAVNNAILAGINAASPAAYIFLAIA